MDNWRAHLRGDPTEWLLGRDNPSVRYFTLTEILGRDGHDPEVKEARDEIMMAGAVPAILAKQSREGAWGDLKKFYTAKYKGTVWQLLILAEHGADGADERIRRACELILENSQDRESGGFSMHSSKEGGGRHSEVIPCLTGNMVWGITRLGHLDDPRVQRGIDWIVRYQRFDDGEGDPPTGWPYDRAVMCLGRHSCHMGVVKSLKALAEIPETKRTSSVRRKIEEGAEYMLIHHVHKRSHDLTKVSKPGWRKFGFPLMYQTDVLEILGILTRLGYDDDDRMSDAIDLLLSKQDDRGRWKLENTYNGRFQVDIEEKEKPSKWITLNAIKVLKRLYS